MPAASEGDLDVVLAVVPRRAGDLDAFPALGDWTLDDEGGKRDLEGVGERPLRETNEVVEAPGPKTGDVARAIRDGGGLAGVTGSFGPSGSGSGGLGRRSWCACESTVR